MTDGEARRAVRREPVWSTARHVATAVVAVVLCGCGGERVTNPNPPGGAGQTDLVIDVAVDVDDAALGTQLTWEFGVPDAVVHVNRMGTPDWTVWESDGAGRVTLGPVFTGRYRVFASRRLSEGEADAVGESIRAWGDGLPTQVESDEANHEALSLRADRPGTVVISEVMGYSPPPWETGGTGYEEALYIELYNNSDHIEFLDGRLLGATLHGTETIGGQCAVSAGPRADPGGVLATQILAFPGAGPTYPIGPGETRLIAISAIDHTGVHPDLPDLSHADFEIRGVASADNPAVPDMLDVGLERFVLTAGGGSITPLTMGIRGYFVAEPQDPQSLPVVFRDVTGRPWVRIPGPTLLDVAALTVVWPDAEREFPPCSPVVSRPFDRFEGGFFLIGTGEEPNLSFQRVVVREDNGQAVLQDTDTSAADFTLARPTPGRVTPR